MKFFFILYEMCETFIHGLLPHNWPVIHTLDKTTPGHSALILIIIATYTLMHQ